MPGQFICPEQMKEPGSPPGLGPVGLPRCAAVVKAEQ